MIFAGDPRMRMRNALRDLVRAEPDTWQQPSLTIFRNRLLDATGSDARPLAELLLEAITRGGVQRLSQPMDAARWEALTAQFVMQWSVERFVQLDMARWATETWAFAFGVIDVEQLRIAPPQKMQAPITVLSQTTRSASVSAARNANGTKGTSRVATRGTSSRLNTRPNGVSPTPVVRYARPAIAHVNPKVLRATVGVAAFLYLSFVTRMAFSVYSSKATANVNAQVVPSRLSVDSIATPRSTRVAKTAADTGVARASTAQSSALADTSRMMLVEPPRRALGATVPIPDGTPSSGSIIVAAPVTYDEVRLIDGQSLRGRVEVIRAGTILFRDMRSGLRHEFRKDEVDEIITEFGTPVRFRAVSSTAAVAKRAAVSARVEGTVTTRSRGVGGRYMVTYAAAAAVGSRDCLGVWNRPAGATDRAIVTHVPGADTLIVSIVGGETFPSNVDAEGYFASTFRIQPNQARTSTAFTTRLSGRFDADGALSYTVNIVFFRRMREGADLSCSVSIRATGQRQSP